jgi:sRNA-binding carbon storage regulator CsrA
MLVVSRRSDESILIKLADGVDSNLTLADLFANGPIEITLLGGNGRRVKMGIAAPPQLSIRRKDREVSA